MTNVVSHMEVPLTDLRLAGEKPIEKLVLSKQEQKSTTVRPKRTKNPSNLPPIYKPQMREGRTTKD